jgi:F0F1-type ATP synthase membrane subunit a
MYSLAAEQVNLMEHVVGHDLFTLGHDPHAFHFTNQMLMSLIAAALMLLIFPRLFGRATADAPTGGRNFFEAILEFLRIEVFRPALKEHTDRFVPFLWTVFFFILFSNLLGLIPTAALISLVTGGHVKDIGGTPTGTITTTATLAIIAFIVIHVSGVSQVARDLIRGTYGHHGHHEEHSSNGTKGHEAAMDLEHMRGEALAADVPQDFKATFDPTKHYKDDEHHHRHHAAAEDAHGKGKDPLTAWLLAIPLYIWNFAPHPFKPQPGQSSLLWLGDIPMWLMLLVLEFIGAFIKPFALCMRLFANMIAGHMVLASLTMLIILRTTIVAMLGVAVPVMVLMLMISLLEVFVAFLQAYIFTFLATLFIASAVAPEH